MTPGSQVRRGDAGESGSVGAIVRWRHAPGLYLLSNAHVLAFPGAAAPAAGDVIVDAGSSQPVARLAYWTPFRLGSDFPNRVDAALAVLAEGSADTSSSLRLASSLSPGRSVHLLHKPGVEGRIKAVGVPIELSYLIDGLGHQNIGLRGQVLCEVYSEAGDSGGLVLDDAGDVVGLHVAGGDLQSLFTPIWTVFEELEVTWMAELSYQTFSSAVDVLARTVFGEARGEADVGQIAVAAVVANRCRANRQEWGGARVEDVCLHRWQFTSWAPQWTDFDFERDFPAQDRENVRANYNAMKEAGPLDPVFFRCLEIARAAIKGTLADPTGGATNFFDPKAARPKWADEMTRTASIGGHDFFV